MSEIFWAVLAFVLIPVLYGLWDEWRRLRNRDAAERRLRSLDPLSEDWAPRMEPRRKR